jgi:putative ABC transport system permease protein
VALAVLALGFGIGANSAIFSFLNAFVLRPLPSVADAHRVVTIEGRRRGGTMGVFYADFLDWRQPARAFSLTAATESFDPIVTGAGEPERVPGARVSAGFFDLFTARPALGRVFSPQDYAPPPGRRRSSPSATNTGSAGSPRPAGTVPGVGNSMPSTATPCARSLSPARQS